MGKDNESLSLEQIKARTEQLLEDQRQREYKDFDPPVELKNLFEVWADSGLQLSSDPNYCTNWARVRYGFNLYLVDMGFSELRLSGKQGGSLLMSLFRTHFKVGASKIKIGYIKRNPYLYGVEMKDGVPAGEWYDFVKPMWPNQTGREG